MKDAGQVKFFKQPRITGLMGLPSDSTLPVEFWQQKALNPSELLTGNNVSKTAVRMLCCSSWIDKQLLRVGKQHIQHSLQTKSRN